MKRILLGAALCALASAACAAEITLYEQDNFGGRRAVADTYVNDLAATGFYDFATSIVVRSGTWEVCDDANFQGRCMRLNPGEYPSLQSMGLDDRVASVREVGYAPPRVVDTPVPAPSVATVPPPTVVGSGHVVLYEGPNFSGRAITLDRPIVNFENIGFDDRARSAVVYDGAWELCYNSNFNGRCAVYRPGQYASLGGGLDGEVSSARPTPDLTAAVPLPAPVQPSRASLTLFGRPDFRGRSLTIDRALVRDFSNVGFDNNASSLRVADGYWLLCSGTNFEGDCRTFGPGEYASLPRELENHVSSARKISETYPYGNRPNWGSM